MNKKLSTYSIDDAYLNPKRRDVEPRVGQIGHTRMEMKSIDEASRQIHFLCSSNAVDRYGEIVEQAALEKAIPDFMSNPVFPAGHVYIGTNGEPTVIGHWVKLWLSKDGLEGIAKFDPVDPLAIRYWNHYVNGNLKAVSIGFLTEAWEMREVQIGADTKRVRVFTSVELIEISAVLIGANPYALMRAASLFPGAAPAGVGQKSGGTTADTLDELADLLAEKVMSRIDPRIKSTIEQKLHAGPGGPMCNLFMDIVEGLHGPVRHGVMDVPDPDSDEDPDGDESANHEDRALIDQVRSALQDAGN